MGMFRIKAKASGGKTDVKMMAKHEMESGQRKDGSGNVIPAMFLQSVEVKHGGNVVFAANLGTAISKNPYIAFVFNGGAKGEMLEVNWTENTGNSGTDSEEIK